MSTDPKYQLLNSQKNIIIIVLLMFNICGLYVLDSYSSSSFD